ncbi:deoxyhypusine synthase [Besnoitia besnoiti]|uniref:deoxyhypusine synthase n=1 Tax=Besnoitia besnoiti TaxID=94643 RepID=A0A2A9MFJ3_BESBE|nr:deoxyhypusine synthase [Besnoitia besnoiti]PFH37268.1 deoxyhypusine synthase [Besnoitia besnoiti]
MPLSQSSAAECGVKAQSSCECRAAAACDSGVCCQTTGNTSSVSSTAASSNVPKVFGSTYTTESSRPPALATDAVLVVSAPPPDDALVAKGVDFEKCRDLDSLLDSFEHSGFQATQLGRAIREVKRMLAWRLSDEPIAEDDIGTEWEDMEKRKNTKCTIWMSFTSNMISSGLREVFRFLCKHKLIDVLVTSAGGVEEDFVKCLAPTLVGDFHLKGHDLREKGWNRVGNLLVPNSNYCLFEDWIQPILDKMVQEQNAKIRQNMGSPDFCTSDAVWTPSAMIKRFGEEINNEDSVFYWCAKNNIPVFCPGLTDGSLGDNLYFHSYRKRGLIVDIVKDIRSINDIATKCRKSGMIILGGGLPKHHTCNANLMRNGADFAVYINTGSEFDGSDSGARPDEAVSWGKITTEAKPVKVHGDATVFFPLVVGATFAKEFHEQKKKN